MARWRGHCTQKPDTHLKASTKGRQTFVTAAPLRGKENEIRIIRLTNGPFKLGRIMARKEKEIQQNEIKINGPTDVIPES